MLNWTISLDMVMVLLVLHFIADFILERDYVTNSESRDPETLLEHIALYSIPFMLIHPFYAIVNAVLHLCVDYVTTRITGYYWAKGKTSEFVAMIMLDQLLHISMLIGTYVLWSHFYE